MLRLYNMDYVRTRNSISLLNTSKKNMFDLILKNRIYGSHMYYHSIRSFHVSNIRCNVDKKNDKLLSTLKQQFNTIKQITIKYCVQFNNHFSKLKVSLKEANRKIMEQEAQFKKTYDNNNNNSSSKNTSDPILTNKAKFNVLLLPSEIEYKRKLWSRKLEFYMDSLQETLFTATRALNDVTGYSSIQHLRNSINQMENDLNSIKMKVKENKKLYNDAINERIQSQNEVNDLLQRKGTWSSEDLERFTRLYKEDTINSKKVEECKQRLNDIEMEEDKLSNELYKSILTRYHEEQIWSDKIRRTSTWGTFILMGINICLFLIFQLLLEPWKRRRLTRSFEDKVKIALDTYSKEQENLILMKIEEILSSTTSKEVPIIDINRNHGMEERKEEKVIDSCKNDFDEDTQGLNQNSNPYVILKQLYFKLTQVPRNKNLEFNSIEIYLLSGTLLLLGNLLTIIVHKLI